MINPHETEAFDFLYNFVHKHAEGVYYLTFQDGVQISAEYDTDYDCLLYTSPSPRDTR